MLMYHHISRDAFVSSEAGICDKVVVLMESGGALEVGDYT